MGGDQYHKMFFPEFFHKFHSIPIKIPKECFLDIETPILKFTWKNIYPQLPKLLQGKNEDEELLHKTSKFFIKLWFNKRKTVILARDEHIN